MYYDIFSLSDCECKKTWGKNVKNEYNNYLSK